MEGHCLTGQSPLQAVEPMEVEFFLLRLVMKVVMQTNRDFIEVSYLCLASQ